jgi:hypothetical protein
MGKLFYIMRSGVDIEERIDIHTQTARKARSANPGGNQDDVDETVEDEEEDGESGRYRHKSDLDMEWKTQSLPSLGRVSSEQTLESSGDEFAALRRNAPTRMLKSGYVSVQIFCKPRPCIIMITYDKLFVCTGEVVAFLA